jgi:hypothetical protein
MILCLLFTMASDFEIGIVAEQLLHYRCVRILYVLHIFYPINCSCRWSFAQELSTRDGGSKVNLNV